MLVLLASACYTGRDDPLAGNIQVYPGNTGADNSQADQPSTQPALQTIQAAPSAETTERQVTVTASNSVFSIGLPPGYTEERTIKASEPIDIWFEYLSADMSLELNGSRVDIPVRRTTEKLGYLPGITEAKYVMKNLSSQYLSYNLRMYPAGPATSVPLVTTEKWTAP